MTGKSRNLTDGIAIGRDLPALVRRLQEADGKRHELARQLQAMGDGPIVRRLDWRATERQARRLLADWRGLLRRPVVHGRELLRQLLVAPIRFTPFAEGGRRGYRFAGEASLTGLFAGLVEVLPFLRPPA